MLSQPQNRNRVKSGAEVSCEPEVADALAAAIGRREGRARVAARRREQEVTEAASREEEEAVISGLQVEMRALCATDPGMTLLMAVEYSTSNPGHRIALYRRCSAGDQSIGADKDLGLLERRARAEDFRFR